MSQLHRQMRPLLGTFVEVGCLSEERHLTFASPFKEIELINNLLSFHSPDSDLTKLNLARGEPVQLHAQSLRVLKLARAASIASGGLFNPTVGGELQRLGHLPSGLATSAVASAPMPWGTALDLELTNTTARLLRPVKIVLDGIAKGYAVDRAIGAMKRAGFTAGWVNAGGDMRVFGDLSLPISRRKLNGEIEDLGGLKNLSIATSQVSATYSPAQPSWIFTEQNLNPKIGVYTVLARFAWRADALTKVACLAPSQDVHNIVNRLGGKVI